MRKSAYIPPENIPINIGIINLDFKHKNNLELIISRAYTEKIKNYLEWMKGHKPQFIIFPEYSYHDDLYELYLDYSRNNDCVIIGGTKLYEIDRNLYAGSPIFLPGRELDIVWKRHITDLESLKNYRIISYPHKFNRDFTLEFGDTDINFSIFICKDFLQEYFNYLNPTKRQDLFFVIQYDSKPHLFREHAAQLSTEIHTYVLGVNKGSLSSIGTGTLNDYIIQDFYDRGFRAKIYENIDKAVIYDFTQEKAFIIKVDIGCPVALPHTRSRLFKGTNVFFIAEYEKLKS